MAENQEIKVNEQAFETAISKLKTYVESFEQAKNRFSSVNQKLSGDWIGDGGNSFRNVSAILEDDFQARINNLKQEIIHLENTKQYMTLKDSNIADQIKK